MLASLSAKLIAAGAVVLVIAGLGAYGWGEHYRAQAAAVQAQDATRRADDTQRAFDALQARQAAADAAVKSALAAAQQAQAAADKIKDSIRHAPNSSACNTSPAVRALLDGLRGPGPLAAPVGVLQNPGGAARVPSSAAAPR